MHPEDYIADALELVSAWDIPDERPGRCRERSSDIDGRHPSG